MQTRLARAPAAAVICSFTLSVSRSCFLHTGWRRRRRLLQKSLRVISFPCRVVNHGDARLLLQHGSVARAFPGSAPTSARREGTTRPVFSCCIAYYNHIVMRCMRQVSQAAMQQLQPNTAFVLGSAFFGWPLQSYFGNLKYITWHCMIAIFIYNDIFLFQKWISCSMSFTWEADWFKCSFLKNASKLHEFWIKNLSMGSEK